MEQTLIKEDQVYKYILSTPLEQTLIIYIVCMILLGYLFSNLSSNWKKNIHIKVLKVRTGVSMYALGDLVWLLSDRTACFGGRRYR